MADERCVLCLDQKKLPVSIDCGHTFCSSCLNVYKSYRGYAWANKCPICRCEIKEMNQFNERNLNSQEMSSHSFVPVSENNSSASLPSLPTQYNNNTLEEFISIAATYFDDNQSENDLFDSFENMDVNDQDLSYNVQVNTPYSSSDDEHSNEDETYEPSEENNVYYGYYDDDELYTDHDDHYADDDLYSNHGHHYADDDLYTDQGDDYADDEFSNEPIEYPSPQDYALDQTFLNDDDDGVDDYGIDWESVIDTDVIIID